VAQIGQEPRIPGAELRVAVARLLPGLRMAGLFGGLWFLAQGMPYPKAPSTWVARTNLLLALFNMIPGFLLDGGRVLRALVWRVTGDFHSAVQVAAATRPGGRHGQLQAEKQGESSWPNC
jgi:Zn-dependent protease